MKCHELPMKFHKTQGLLTQVVGLSARWQALTKQTEAQSLTSLDGPFWFTRGVMNE